MKQITALFIAAMVAMQTYSLLLLSSAHLMEAAVSAPASNHLVNEPQDLAPPLELLFGQPYNTPDEDTPFSQRFNLAVEEWIALLAQKHDFKHWKQADWKSVPLGPGTHSWLITIYSEHKESGYLVISSTPQGELQLTEYGSGDHPLFSLSTLNQVFIQHDLFIETTNHPARLPSDTWSLPEVERLYFGPFQAVWQLTGEDYRYYFDAVTGEAYPLTAQVIRELTEEMKTEMKTESKSALHLPMQLSRSIQWPWFDPYEHIGWVEDSPQQIETMNELILTLQSEDQRLVFTIDIFNEMIKVPFAVLGYDRWVKDTDNHDIYDFVLLDQEGQRFIPFSTLQQAGHFFVQHP